MIRITFIMLLSLKSLGKAGDSYCIGVKMDQFTFQNRVEVLMTFACQPMPVAAFEARPAVSGAYKYDTKGLLGPPK